ncbi:MAG: HipA domain-containing protein [bacterium]|nr:HipA domain-containing protein [Candidatus Limimorpha equi]
MAQRQSKDILVYIDLQSVPILIGVLHCEVVRGKEVFSFELDSDWLKSRNFRQLDPDLGRFAGFQYLKEEKSNFGVFLDSSPDRWGRMLIKRRETLSARAENRSVRTLFESDFLLGVYDENRMGALRFKTDLNGSFLDDSKTLAAPPWTSIRDLEYASLQLENENITETDARKWLNMLLAPGSSLGGARPKANVKDDNGNLWIAKFPSKNDEKDMGAWELLANRLAKQCNIQVPECQSKSFSSQRHTFLSKRFDRGQNGQRIHFASAMTMLGLQDGDDFSTGASYLMLAEFLLSNGANVDADLRELWRRIVFNIAISNCDDHLRNHGFLLTPKGWVLSPAFDLNPDEYGNGLKLNISENDNSLDFDLALEIASYFRISNNDAKSVLEMMKGKVSRWRNLASMIGISKYEQEMCSAAFRV